MREFIKMFFWGMACFFVPFFIFAIALVLFVFYGFQALMFITMIIYGVCWLFARNPAEARDFAHAFFYFGAISMVMFGLSVAFLGQVHKLFRAMRARLKPPLIPYPSDPFTGNNP
jgi:hypothetical protein